MSDALAAFVICVFMVLLIVWNYFAIWLKEDVFGTKTPSF